MKQTISIIVIIAALAGAGVFAYMTFFSGSADVPLVSTSATTAQGTTSEILPMGSGLNFDVVERYNKDRRFFQYPSVNTSEIGSIMGSMVKQ
jgi:hypothetical protein